MIETENETKTVGRGVKFVAGALYVVGLLAGLWLGGGTIWANLEASLFDTAIRYQATLDTLSCPALLTTAETGQIEAAFVNGTDQPKNFLVRANISQGFVTLIREIPTTLRVAAGETETLAWTVTAEDAAYGRFILARVIVLSSPPYPARDASCGIWVVDMSLLGGRQLTALAFVLSVVGLGGGWGLWLWQQTRPLDDHARRIAVAAAWLALFVVATMVVGLLGYWFAGLLLIIFALLMAGALLERFSKS